MGHHLLNIISTLETRNMMRLISPLAMLCTLFATHGVHGITFVLTPGYENGVCYDVVVDIKGKLTSEVNEKQLLFSVALGIAREQDQCIAAVHQQGVARGMVQQDDGYLGSIEDDLVKGDTIPLDYIKETLQGAFLAKIEAEMMIEKHLGKRKMEAWKRMEEKTRAYFTSISKLRRLGKSEQDISSIRSAEHSAVKWYEELEKYITDGGFKIMILEK